MILRRCPSFRHHACRDTRPNCTWPWEPQGLEPPGASDPFWSAPGNRSLERAPWKGCSRRESPILCSRWGAGPRPAPSDKRAVHLAMLRPRATFCSGRSIRSRGNSMIVVYEVVAHFAALGGLWHVLVGLFARFWFLMPRPSGCRLLMVDCFRIPFHPG